MAPQIHAKFIILIIILLLYCYFVKIKLYLILSNYLAIFASVVNSSSQLNRN